MKSITLAAAAAYMSAFADASVIIPPGMPAIIPRADASPTGQGVEQPSSKPITMQPVVQGCFKDFGELVLASTEDFNSRGKCGQEICQVMGKNVAASMEKKCYCGDKYPSKASLAEDKNCNIPCPGFGVDACGGLGSGGAKFFTVYNTGLELYDVQSSDSTTSTSSDPTVASTAASGETVFVTQSSQSSSDNKSGGTNTAGIAAGVVVAVVAVGAGIGAVFFFLRRKRNREIEEEHRRNAAVNSFINGSKPPSSSGGVSISDSRLDPVMAQRRFSSGSINDNEDYSRRILRVTNA